MVRRHLFPLLAGAVAGALVLGASSAGCTDGTTPDCSSPEAGCNPDTDGALPVFDASDSGDVGTGDSAADALSDTGSDAAADAGQDSPADAPSDGG